MDMKEKLNGFFTKLPFNALAEKIPAETRAKVPALNKAIPWANHIACGLAVVLAFGLVLAACSKNNSSGGNTASAPSKSASKASGKEAKETDFKYELNKAGDGVVITGYQADAAGGEVVIPAKIEGYPVVAVRGDDFSEGRQAYLNKIYPPGVNFDWAPKDDWELEADGVRPRITSIVFPDSVTDISANFFYCVALKSVTFPKDMKKIDASFTDCTNLTTIKWPENLEEIGGSAFNRSGITELVIPEGVKVIGAFAFQSCENLTSVTIPDSVVEIKYGAFEWCSSLSTVKMPAHPIKYERGGDAFKGCPKLTGIAVRKAIQDTGYTGSF